MFLLVVDMLLTTTNLTTKEVPLTEVNVGDLVIFGASPLKVVNKTIEQTNGRTYLHFGPDLKYGSKTPVTVVIR